MVENLLQQSISTSLMYSPVVIRLHEAIKPTSALRPVQVTDWVE